MIGGDVTTWGWPVSSATKGGRPVGENEQYGYMVTEDAQVSAEDAQVSADWLHSLCSPNRRTQLDLVRNQLQWAHQKRVVEEGN